METKQAQRPAASQADKTKNLSKLSEESNAITWFEIPVSDMKRAKKFYETVLDIQLTTAKAEGDMEAMELFPRLPNVSMGRTDVVSGSDLMGRSTAVMMIRGRRWVAMRWG
jgi:hypothetical protein